MESIKEELMQLDQYPVECDGMAKLVVDVLRRNGQEFKCYSGTIPSKFGGEVYHQWVVWNGFRVDLRANMWLPDSIESIPFFADDSVENPIYKGKKEFVMPELSPVLITILKM